MTYSYSQTREVHMQKRGGVMCEISGNPLLVVVECPTREWSSRGVFTNMKILIFEVHTTWDLMKNLLWSFAKKEISCIYHAFGAIN